MDVDLRVGQRRLPEVARLGGESCLVARDAACDPRHADQLLRRVLGAVVAQRDARHVVVEGAEAKRRRRARGNSALRRAVERVARVEAQPVPLDVAVGAVTGLDRQHVRPRVEREDDALVRRGDGEGDVRAARRTARAVVDVPAAVDRRLRLVGAGRDRARLERVDAVAVRILEPRLQAVGLPVAGTAELGLVAAGSGHDQRVDGVGDPVRHRVEGERHAAARAGEQDVVAARVTAVALVPGVVQRHLVLPVAGRHGEAADEDAVGRRQVGRGTVRRPVARAAELRLQVACDRRGRRRGRGGWPDHDGEQQDERHSRTAGRRLNIDVLPLLR